MVFITVIFITYNAVIIRCRDFFICFKELLIVGLFADFQKVIFFLLISVIFFQYFLIFILFFTSYSILIFYHFFHTISPKVLTGVFISVVIKGFRALCLLKRPKKIVNNKAISLFSVARVQSCFFISALKRYLLKCLKSSKKAVWLVLLSAMYLAF